MKILFGFLTLALHTGLVYAQAKNIMLRQAVRKLQQDDQMKHALLSLCVVNSRTGELLVAENAQVGVPAASTQKVITSAAAFELLGKSFRYKTELAYSGALEDGEIKGNLYVLGSGDPSFGSRRWESTLDSLILKKWLTDIRKANIKRIAGVIDYNLNEYSFQTIPDGWIWQDLGNYYGAGADIINWRENQYDLILKSANQVGGKVEVTTDKNSSHTPGPFYSELSAAAKGTGDNAYIYLPAGRSAALLKGTIPAGESRFSISGAMQDAPGQFLADLELFLRKNNILIKPRPTVSAGGLVIEKGSLPELRSISVHYSPSLDSLNYWFIKKSINLYGEALLKTFARQKGGLVSTEKGVEVLKEFWAARGIERSALNIMDGSGLSPQNRITTDALVKVMQFARTKPWFNTFYDALLEINGIKMKSGSISGTRSFTGYIKSRQGIEYTFAVVISNFDGSASAIVRRIYSLLDLLK